MKITTRKEYVEQVRGLIENFNGTYEVWVMVEVDDRERDFERAYWKPIKMGVSTVDEASEIGAEAIKELRESNTDGKRRKFGYQVRAYTSEAHYFIPASYNTY